MLTITHIVSVTVGKVSWDPRIYERQIEEKKRKEEEEERKKKEAAKRAMNLLTNKTSKTSTQVILTGSSYW